MNLKVDINFSPKMGNKISSFIQFYKRIPKSKIDLITSIELWLIFIWSVEGITLC